MSELMSLRRKDQRGVRFVDPASWHITLRFLGDADMDEVEAALDEADLTAATAVIGPAVDVLGERALVVPVSGLDELAADVLVATRMLGEPAPKRPFFGHLTIARVKRDVVMPPALGAMVDGGFAVEEIELVRSRLDPDGARYDTLSTWSVPSI